VSKKKKQEHESLGGRAYAATCYALASTWDVGEIEGCSFRVKQSEAKKHQKEMTRR
jgi:hypothetical protein